MTVAADHGAPNLPEELPVLEGEADAVRPEWGLQGGTYLNLK